MKNKDKPKDNVEIVVETKPLQSEADIERDRLEAAVAVESAIEAILHATCNRLIVREHIK